METGAAMTAKKYKTRSLWKRFRRRFRDAVLRLLLPAIARLPFGFTRRVFPILAVLVSPFIRRQAIANLDLAYGDSLSAGEKKRIARNVAKNLAMVAAEVFAVWRNKLPDDYLRGREAYDKLAAIMIENGQGCIGVAGHLGNWELMGYWMKKSFPDHLAGIIARRPESEFLAVAALKAREAYGLKSIWQDESMRRSLRLLEAGQMVGIVPDQDVRSITGIFVPFFGTDAYTPTGPAALARFSGCAIAVMIAERKAYGIDISLAQIIEPDPECPRDEDIARMTRAWSDAFEKQIRKQPADWMWFHRRWRSTPASIAKRRERKRAEA